MDFCNPTVIAREPELAAREMHDLIVIGGGIYGAMLCLEGIRRGIRPLLLEKNDFGESTSFNSLRVVHGGFRYLQSMDLGRFFASVNERRWFLTFFPDLVRPMGFVMPLTGKGLFRPSVFHVALLINNWLSWKRNKGVDPSNQIPGGRLLPPQETTRLFPFCGDERAPGSALWYDALIMDTQRLLIEVLKWACRHGATALNYVEALGLIGTARTVDGVAAVDRENGREYRFRSQHVVNAAGPWCREVACLFDRDEPALFSPSLAWNVLFDRAEISSHAVAVRSTRNGRILFLLPWKGRLLGGTGHASRSKVEANTLPTEQELGDFLADLNSAIPDLNLRPSQILHVFSGFVPAIRPESSTIATREKILAHGRNGGPIGLYSISGVKFTTARLVADKTLTQMFPGLDPVPYASIPRPRLTGDGPALRAMVDFDWRPDSQDREWKEDFRTIIREEAVQHIDDLVFRRTSIWENPSRVREICSLLTGLFKWSDECSISELGRLERKLAAGLSMPSDRQESP